MFFQINLVIEMIMINDDIFKSNTNVCLLPIYDSIFGHVIINFSSVIKSFYWTSQQTKRWKDKNLSVTTFSG